MKADIELVDKVKNGDEAAFSELVMRHQKSLLRVCLKMLRDLDMAEDVVQETFIKVYRKIHLFEGRSSFKSWLFQIGINTARNKLRTLKRIQVDVDDVNLSIQAEAEQDLVRDDISEVLAIEVNKLPEKQRVALSLRIYEELSFKEIAQIMDCPYDTAKANYRHGLMKLRDRFKGSDLMKSWLGSVVETSTSAPGLTSEVER